jgi:hypothetical protein
LPKQIQPTFRLTDFDTTRPLDRSITNARPQPVDLLDIFDRIEDKLEALFEDCHPSRRPKFRDETFEATPASRVEIAGVRLPPFGFGAAMLILENTGNLEPGTRYRFQVQQVVNQRVAGGCAYVLQIAGDRKINPPLIATSVDIRTDPKLFEIIESHTEKTRFVPPWAEKFVEEAEKRSGKKA